MSRNYVAPLLLKFPKQLLRVKAIKRQDFLPKIGVINL